MKIAKFQRVAAFILAFVLLVGGGTVAASASGSKDDDSSIITDIGDIKELLSAISYNDYISENADVGRAKAPLYIDGAAGVYTGANGKEVELIDPATDAEEEEAHKNAIPHICEKYGRKAIYVPSSGSVTWTLDPNSEEYAALKEAARYNMQIEYYPEENKSASIERMLRINGTIPFSEARSLMISKIWKLEQSRRPQASFEVPKDGNVDEFIATGVAAGFAPVREDRDGKVYINYTIPDTWTVANSAVVNDQVLRFFIKDIDLNEIRTGLDDIPEWVTYEFKDSNGFLQTPFELVLKPHDETGLVTVSLESVNEPIVISNINMVTPVDLPSYETWKKQYNDAAGAGQIKIEGEYYSAASSQTIYPISDTTSAMNSPSSTKFAILNTVGGDKWQSPGQWIEYKFSVDQSGMYKIAARFKQAVLDGMYTSRILSLYSEGLNADAKGYYNGVPYDEANRVQFDYSSDWQSDFLTGVTVVKHEDGTQEAKEQQLEFYFEKGVTYTLRLEVSLGNMGDVVRRVQESLDAINSDYLNILKLTGSKPDENRDYGFKRVMGDTIIDLRDQRNALNAVAEELANAANIKSSMTATLEKVARLLDTMYTDDSTIAKNLEQLKTYIGSLGTWLSDAKTQPLTLDYLMIQPSDNEALPKAKASFWKALVHEIASFMQSFFRNYNRMGAMTEVTDDDTVEVWLAYGRDQSQVIRGLINDQFTSRNNIAVNLKLVAAATLLPSILSQMGPDVYIGLSEDNVINYAIRGALLPIEDMNGFDDIAADFTDSAMVVMGIEDAEDKMHYYGLPETQSFPMMFVREDILADLNIDIPKTWDDVKEAIPVLQANNMQIGMQKDYRVFLYQKDGELFADNGMRINLDSNVALESFETMCDMFTMYSFPFQFDLANRFRTGEMPIVFAPSYTATYNQLKVFATEIEGLWNFYPMPGYYNEEGVLNNKSVSTMTAIVMIVGCDNVNGSWEFMKWHVDSECQIAYANEMVAIMGPSAKHATANLDALESLPWTAEEYDQLERQFNSLASIPNYPGSYIIGRYTNFAFLDAYNENADPVTELQSYINIINKEITRKRAEFGLETLDYVGQTLAEKRMAQAETALNAIKTSSAYNSAYDEAVNSVLKLISGYETEDYASIRAMADALEELNADLFGTPQNGERKSAVQYLRDAANALESYEAYK
ncbi:MAG: extracellular solute-binding protein [Ruminococcaceae bacterium]|nr:extracellular solute-binding protein [Oscillospiraceae bacterium]